MRHLCFLLLATLLNPHATSVIDVRDRPEECKGPDLTGSSNVAMADDYINSMEYAIRTALDPLDYQLSFVEIYARILIGLKRNSLDMTRAVEFARLMSRVTDGTSSNKYCKLLEIILDIYGTFEKDHEKSEEDLQCEIQENILLYSFPSIQMHPYNISKKLAPWMAKLIKEKGENAENSAKGTAKTLFSLAEPGGEQSEKPYNFVIKAFDV